MVFKKALENIHKIFLIDMNWIVTAIILGLIGLIGGSILLFYMAGKLEELSYNHEHVPKTYIVPAINMIISDIIISSSECLLIVIYLSST